MLRGAAGKPWCWVAIPGMMGEDMDSMEKNGWKWKDVDGSQRLSMESMGWKTKNFGMSSQPNVIENR